MNILYIHRTQARGVEGVHIGEIVRGLRELGHTVALISPVDEYLEVASEDKAKAGGAPKSRHKLLHALSRLMPEVVFELAELAYNFVAIRQAIRRFGNGSDVDAIYERYAIFGIAGAWLARKWGKPFVLEINYTSLCPLVRKRSKLLGPLARWVDSWMFRQATGFAAVSSYLKEQLIREFGVAERLIEVVPNAADPSVFHPIERQSIMDCDTRREVGFVGGFYPWHGLDSLVDAFQIVVGKLPSASLVLIGDGPMRPRIEQKIAKLGLGGKVEVRGRVSHRSLPTHVAHFDIGVMPDSNVYGSPMKIFEYMSMGIPVLVPDYPPLRDVVVDGVEGRIFRPGDTQRMAEDMYQMLHDDQARSAMGIRAREKIVSRHNWRKNSEVVADLMNKNIRSHL